MSTNTTVSTLRQRMIEDMTARNLGHHSQRSHIYSCKRFAAFSKRSPDTATADDDFAIVTLPERDGDALRDLLIAERPGTVIEIGLAYGSSALAIGEALISVGGDLSCCR